MNEQPSTASISILEWASFALLVVTLLCLALKYRSAVGTTLTGPRNWLMGALLLNLLVEVAIAFRGAAPQGSVTALRFAAATALLCPQVAVLGAKRPQDRPWQAIVLALWVVLMLPAAESYFVRRSAALEVHDARGWFLWVLIAVGLFNYLPTRHRLAAVLFAAAQAVLLSAQLPLWRAATSPVMRLIAFGLLTAAAALVVLKRPQANGNQLPLTRLWCDFRDAYGSIWSLRLMDRLNQTSRICQWPITFQWHGPKLAQPMELSNDAQLEASVRRVMRIALRRFVSKPWIAERIGDVSEPSAV